MLEAIRKRFKEHFDEEPIICRAPGRVNIIGEHTDYNDGFVLPFPIEQAIYFAASKRKDRKLHIHAVDLNEDIVIDLDGHLGKESWTRYFTGALRVLAEDGHPISGFNMMVNGNIPFGAGISSSSALTCGFLLSVKELFGLPYSKLDIVFMASRAENGTGVNGGKMDQFAICMGEEGKAILLDCKDYSYQLIDNVVNGAKWFLFNTNVEHNLAETEYNDRRAECEAAVRAIQKRSPEIRSLRDLTSEDLTAYIDLISKKEYDRSRHVVEENERVHEMVSALENEDKQQIGDLLYASHQSLSELYEVSCEELDYIVAHLKRREDCIGARMMGGGFGGSVIALLKEGAQDFKDLELNYKKSFDLEMEIIPVQSRNGISRVD